MLPTPSIAKVVSLHELKTHCSACSMRELCLPMGLDDRELAQLDAVLTDRVRLKKGATLFRAGDPCAALFAVRLGSLKTVVLAEDGREQVTGYHMQGDLVGLEGIGAQRHDSAAVALEDVEVCVLPVRELEVVARKVAGVQRNLHRFLGREIARDHGVMLMLGSMRAEERIAAFLLNLAERHRCRGYSSTEFLLRMTREEIGSFLGLQLETVSRLLSRFQQEGLIQVHGRSVRIIDATMLAQLVGDRR